VGSAYSCEERVVEQRCKCRFQCTPWRGWENIEPLLLRRLQKNGGSSVATQRAFRIRFALGRREAVPHKKTIYRWVSNFRQTGQTLEALKEAIRQKVAAITPEIILKVMDNYQERLHQCINIQGRHLSYVLFKTH